MTVAAGKVKLCGTPAPENASSLVSPSAFVKR
jgi:hypothetical protein